jgi:shikimate kinase
VGRRLAEHLSLPFVDTDEEIRRAAGKTIGEIFAGEGEEGFRARERRAVASLRSMGDAVIAAGGGAVEAPENVRDLKKLGVVVWLSAPPEELLRRVAGDPSSAASRPPLTDAAPLAEMEAIVERRELLYRAAADVQVATDGRTMEEVAAEVEKILRKG